MPKLFTVDSKGASVASLAEARERFDEANISAFGANLDTRAHTPQNQIAGINALVWSEVGEDLLRAALWGSSPEYARGVFLDALGGLLDIRRENQTFTRVTASLRGTSGASVPAGSLAKTSAGDLFRLENDVNIAGVDGTPATFVAVEPGPIPCGVGDLSNVVSVRSGWDSVYNEDEGVVGHARETDARYRANILARTAQSSIGSVAALKSAIAAAGADKVKVVENTSSSSLSEGGIVLPAHSVLVLADGGIADDLGRAVENHRGMGVGTYSAIIGRRVPISQIQEISNGRLRFNGTDLTGLNFSDDDYSDVATEVSALSNALEVKEDGGRFLAFHSWSPSSKGFEDVGGSVARSADSIREFGIDDASYYRFGVNGTGGMWIRLVFSDYIQFFSSLVRPVITYEVDGVQSTYSPSHLTGYDFGNMAGWYAPGTLPANATNFKVTLSGLIRNEFYQVAPVGNAILLREEEVPVARPPNVPQLYGIALPTSIRVYAWAFGGVSQWQYRRYENGAYLDAGWVTAQGQSGQILGNSSNGYEITGFTSGLSNSKVDIRAVHNTYGATPGRSIVFDTSASAPQLESAVVDGRSIELKFDTELHRKYSDSSLSVWNISKAGVSAIQQRIYGKRVFLTTNNPVLPTDTGVTISYNSPLNNSRRVESVHDVPLAAFSNRALTNAAVAGIPARPAPVIVYETQTGYRAAWIANDTGGQVLSNYEYRVTYNNGVSWTDWQSTALATSITKNEPIPDIFEVRGSTPNARAASILGLSDVEVHPFMRSVERPLSITLTIASGSSLTGNDPDAIRTALITRVLRYDLGETLRVADLEAEVERLPRVHLHGSLVAQSGGASVDGVAQNTYNKWTLATRDITIEFQDS